jgi:transcriptional regulator with XRE-family HTH domain
LPVIDGIPRRRARTGRPAKYPILVPFAQRLEQLRHDRRLTQRTLAQRVGISANHCKDIAHADGNPTAIVLLRLAATLGVSIGDLFDVGSSLPPAPFDDADRELLRQLLHHVEHAGGCALALRARLLFEP